MKRVGRIPRNLVGAGGVRLYDIPGVYYPDYMLSDSVRCRKNRGEKLDSMPDWAISSESAAAMLGCLPSSARSFLHRRRVRFCRVTAASGKAIICWEKRRVRELAARNGPVLKAFPKRLMTEEEALATLHVTRNTLRSFVRSKQLQKFHVRVAMTQCVRLYNAYLRSEVKVLHFTRLAKMAKPARKANLEAALPVHK